ncbi:hypothetical protein NW765_002246 [Fusarium oxysporum]|nr:hypothetical protein NW765_002246 [Fusarium oxysporum]
MENCASKVGTESKRRKQKSKKVNKVPQVYMQNEHLFPSGPSFCDPYPKPLLKLNSKICPRGIRSSWLRRQVFLVVVVSARFRSSTFSPSMLANPCRAALRCGGDLRHSHPSQICIPTQNALT